MNAHGSPELLYGLNQIGGHLGLSVRQAKHLHDESRLPTFKIGRTVCARRSDLDSWLEAQARRAIEGGNGDV